MGLIPGDADGAGVGAPLVSIFPLPGGHTLANARQTGSLSHATPPRSAAATVRARTIGGHVKAAAKLLCASLITAVALAPLPPIAAQAAPVKAGAPCAKLNAQVSKKGKTLVCKRVKGKLVWTLLKPTFSDNYQAVASDIDTCQLAETRNQTGAGAKGFPIRGTLPAVGELKIAIIPVDFANAPGVGNPSARLADDIPEISEWGEFFSRGTMQYRPFLASPTWLRAPKGAEWYVCVECQKGASESKQSMAVGLQQLIDLADPAFDFSGTDFVYFLFPHEAESKFGTSMYFHSTTINTTEGPQQVSVYGERGGSSQPEANLSPVWSHLLHELLHFQGWIGHGPFNDTSIMTNDGGPSKAVTSWEAFMAGWFGAQEIVCLDAASLRTPIYVTMSPLDLMESKPVSVMVRLSEEELLVIERRSSGKYSNFAAATNYAGQLKDLNHFTVYRVNVNDPYQRVDGRDFADIGSNFWGYVLENGQLRVKRSVTYKGLDVTVMGSQQIRLRFGS